MIKYLIWFFTLIVILYIPFCTLFHHYMQGYIYWSGEDPDDEESEAHQRIEIYKWLKSQHKSPYKINWHTKL